MYTLLRHTKRSLFRFEKCDGGAVTADWVVLTSAIVIFGSVMIGIYKGGVFNLSSAISQSVVSQAPDPNDSPWR